MSGSLLELKDVSISFGGKGAVKHVNLSLAAGKTLAVVGASGSGKSTLLNAVQGILPHSAQTEGEILFDGKPLSRERAGILAGREITMIFQNAAASFCPTRTVGSQLKELAAAHTSWTQEEFLLRVHTLLEKLALPPRVLEQYPFELSGGMGQRAGLLSAMLLSPRLLLADEPTSALDKVTRRRAVMELKSIVQMQGTAMLLVTHHIGVAAYLADQILVMKDGKAVEQGTADEILSRPQSAYTRQLVQSTMYRIQGGWEDAGNIVGK